tara:strand:- start:2956 stop:3240 length:285 start_codon:yes stop_codon:yes gene_type:complete
MELSEYVKQRRTELNLSLGKLQMRSGIAKGHLHQIEKGTVVNLTVATLMHLAAALQVDAVSLFRIAADLRGDIKKPPPTGTAAREGGETQGERC